MKAITRGATMIAVFVSGALALAQDEMQGQPQTQGQPQAQQQGQMQQQKLSTVEKSFVGDIGALNQGEIELAQLGVDKAQSDAVRKYAQDVLNDHRDAGNKLMQALQGTDVQMVSKAPASATQIKNQLSRLSGDNFDRQFMSAMIDQHEKAIDLMQVNQNRIQNANLASWVSQTLPVLQRHLSMAESVQAQILSGKAGQPGGYQGEEQKKPEGTKEPAPSDSGNY